MAYVINPVAPTISYTATAGQTVFTVPFAFFASTDLIVKDNGVVQAAVNYTVSGAMTTSGGLVTFLSGRTLGHTITIERSVPIQRVTDFPTSGPFNVDLLNEDLDRITAILQELALAPNAAANLLNDAAAYAAAAGSSATTANSAATAASGASTAASASQAAAATSAADAAAALTAASSAAGQQGQVRLSYVSTTSIRLDRCNGTKLFVNGANRDVPSAGITLSNSGLSASTLYYIYAFMSGATMTLEASTTAPAADSTYGHQIKTGDSTRSLVGKVFMNGGGLFEDSAILRYVASWFNRQLKTVANSQSANSSSTTFAVLQTMSFLGWPGDTASFLAIGSYTNGSLQAGHMRALLNGVVGPIGDNQVWGGAANLFSAVSAGVQGAIIAGQNTVTVDVKVDGGTGGFAFFMSGLVLA